MGQGGSGYRRREVHDPGGTQEVPAASPWVERTFAWLPQNRRVSKDYERLPETGETLIYAAMSRLMARRLARS